MKKSSFILLMIAFALIFVGMLFSVIGYSMGLDAGTLRTVSYVIGGVVLGLLLIFCIINVPAIAGGWGYIFGCDCLVKIAKEAEKGEEK